MLNSLLLQCSKLRLLWSVLSGRHLAVLPFLNLVLSRSTVAGCASLNRSFSRSPGIDFRADFVSWFGAGLLNLAA
jgi:hypothetical protein